MTEAANILNNATRRSLVILDEIGRGTSTYDGVSLAWAITEYLHDVVACRSLFATHYHELAALASSLPRLRNYNVHVQENDREVIFLHKIGPGNADKSYGIHVARLAGVPDRVLARAEEVLASLEPAAPRGVVTAPAPEPDTEARSQRTRRKAAAGPSSVEPPEGHKPRRKPEPQPAGPSLFGEAGDAPF
jgi:DNA mismatch repair protein MutS